MCGEEVYETCHRITLRNTTRYGAFSKRNGGGTSTLTMENDSYQPQSTESWVRFALRGAVSTLASVGTPGRNSARYPGTILIQVFTPLATGDAAGRKLADQAAQVFEGAKLEGFDIGLPYVSVAEEPNEDGWYQINVTVPFTRSSYK